MVDIMLPLTTCIFVVFDLASGGVAACANHKWKSSEMRKGLYHKFGSIMLLVLEEYQRIQSMYLQYLQ